MDDVIEQKRDVMPSVSVVEMFSPERLIMLLLRSKKKNQPFSS